MTIWKLRRAVFLYEMRQARTALVVLGAFLVAIVGLLAWKIAYADRYDAVGGKGRGDDVICRRYDGAEVCFPAPPASLDYRTERRKLLAERKF